MGCRHATIHHVSWLVIINILNLSFAHLAYAQTDERGIRTQRTDPQESHIALIIGNSAYSDGPLQNPVNDARAMSQALRDLGFEVIYGENLSQNEMKRLIRVFGNKISNGGVGLFYYAGHGVQANGVNYLIPVGATITKVEEVEYESVDVGFVLAQMENAKNRLNLVILDACRNNPFARSFRSIRNGLASIDAPSGTLIAYATAPGSVASDGDGKNGLYTQELLKYMRTPALNIEQIFKQVRIAVRDKTQGRQIPWESSSLVGDFYFTRPVAVSLNSPASSADLTAVELSFWESIKTSNDPADFKAYIQEYPNGRFVALARNRLNSFGATAKPIASSTTPTSSAPPNNSRPALPLSVENIVDQYVMTLGVQKNNPIKSLKMTGKLMATNAGIELAVTIQQKRPNAFRMDAMLQDKTITQAYDGEGGWQINSFQGVTEPQRLIGDELKEAQEQADFDGPLVDYKAKGHTVELLGKEDLEGTPAYKLKLTLKDGDVRYIYIDAANYIALKFTTKRKSPDGEQEIDSYTSNYKRVGGVLFPFSIEQKVAGQTQIQIAIDKIEIDAPVDDAIFKMPVKAAEEPQDKPPIRF